MSDDAPGPAASPRARILATAFRLFYARGVRAVGVDTLVAESGVAKATFYRHFPGKDTVVLAYLDRVDAVWTGQLRRAAAAAGTDPADRLVALFDALGTAGRRAGYRGCAFINAAAEADPGGAVHARTVAHKHAVLGWVTSLATEAGARDPSGLARQLTLLLDGALAAGAVDPDPAVVGSARVSATALVAAALQPGSTTGVRSAEVTRA